METGRVGKRGVVVVPARLRKKFGIEEGSLVITEEREDGILIRPAVALPVEIYTPARRAQFLLSNAVDRKDYMSARREVKKMGLDPDKIPHYKTKR
jgi:AbrB family looped-hinge helix DNA binding protein